jgi:hypothetical protein
MIIAIDESGSFNPNSKNIAFFIGIQLRQRKSLYRSKYEKFQMWERAIPGELKNHRGEVKGAALTDQQLTEFAEEVLRAHPHIWITPVGIRPSENPVSVVEKHRYTQWVGIRKGVEGYTDLERAKRAQTYDEFSYWFKKLSYDQYLKILLLGECIVHSLINSFGHSISGKYDDELVRLRLLIDRDFVKEPRSNIFWHELLRNQLFHITKEHPVPMLDRWEKRGHPVIDKYRINGVFDLNELFWKHTEFVKSHEYFEVRIADVVATIFNRYYNRRECIKAFTLVKPSIARGGRVVSIILNDFDVEQWQYDPDANPWKSLV